MRTNIDIDKELIEKAIALFGVSTKREAVHIALKEAIQLRQQEAIMGLWGLGWEGDLDEMRTDKPVQEYG